MKLVSWRHLPSGALEIVADVGLLKKRRLVFRGGAGMDWTEYPSGKQATWAFYIQEMADEAMRREKMDADDHAEKVQEARRAVR